MYRIASFNVNGIRATLKRGFETWLAESGCNAIGIQEVRCPVKSLPENCFAGYYATYNPGKLAGRNGVAILTKQPPAAVRSWGEVIGYDSEGNQLELTAESTTPPIEQLEDYANEGRYVEVDLADAPITLGCLYLPKGATADEDEAKYLRKQNFMASFTKYLAHAISEAKQKDREFLVIGDFNIAHEQLDLKNWRSNTKSEGFLPEERQWVTDTLAETGLVDVVRAQNPQTPGPYSWWSWRGQAFTNDSGWRIDYHLATNGLAETAIDSFVAREDSYESRRSDHAAVVVDYQI